MESQISMNKNIELGNAPNGVGAILKGWHGGPGSVLDFRAMTGACEHDCFHCFTDKRKKTLTLEEIEGVIDQAAELGFKGIDYLGEGEPTLDKDFFRIIEYTASKGMVPVVFTDAATKLLDKEFVRRIYDSGTSVCPKCDSLFNADYQNWVVKDKTGTYFDKRNLAIDELKKQGFNKPNEDKTTRLGFDMVVTKRNVDEVEQTLRYCRDNNMWVVFSTFLPAGRSGSENFDKSLVLSSDEISKMRKDVKKVDLEYDGSYWHKDDSKDLKRDMDIKSTGWTIIRVKDKQIRKMDSKELNEHILKQIKGKGFTHLIK